MQSLKEPDKSAISLIRVNNEKELRLYNVDELALDLSGHPAYRNFPIYVVFHHGQLVGYFHATQQLVVYPALHPEKMKPQAFVKLVRSLVTEMKRHVGNPLFLLCPKALSIGERGMKLMRLKKAPEEAYVYAEQ